MSSNKCLIVYLVRGTEQSLAFLRESLSLVHRNFLPYNPADILVFHENNVGSERITSLCPKLNVRTKQVDFSETPTAFLDHPTSLNFGLGYRHMCHFFANDYLLLRELDGYDYVMRLDDDSFILSPLKEKIFEYMRQAGIKYTYRCIEEEDPKMCTGMWETADLFFKSNPQYIKGTLPPKSPCLCYYTNFEICDIKWFRGTAWQSFFAAIDATGGIWRTRWGDAPIRYLGVKSLLSTSEIYCLKSLHYYHQSVWMPGHETRCIYNNLYWFLTHYFPNACKHLKRITDRIGFLSRIVAKFRNTFPSFVR